MGSVQSLDFALGTDSEKIDTVPPNREIGHPAGILLQIVIHRHVEITDFPTTFADQMIVYRGFCIEPIERTTRRNPLYEALGNQKGHIAVHRTQAELWKFHL